MGPRPPPPFGVLIRSRSPAATAGSPATSGCSDSTLRTTRGPWGGKATWSVKVPPRSIQKRQPACKRRDAPGVLETGLKLKPFGCGGRFSRDSANQPPNYFTICYSNSHISKHPRLIAMGTDYTAAITSVIALVVVLTGMVAYVLTRPSDLAPKTR